MMPQMQMDDAQRAGMNSGCRRRRGNRNDELSGRNTVAAHVKENS